MILADVRDYLRTHRRAALFDLSIRFDTEPEALRGMLDTWIAKGKVARLPEGTRCGGCSHCDPHTVEIYEWRG
jgi:putative ferrous iron transport protein C